MKNARSVFVISIAIWLVVTTSLVTAVTWRNPYMRAVLGMGWGLILLWIGVSGMLMYCFREPIRAAVLKIQLGWRLKFILFATLLALTEEAITTTMTNLAPLFGVKVGEAYITASTNFLDVVALHSVVMFVPLFVGWAVILSRYAFSPFSVFLLFGLTGTAMETNLGLKNPLQFGLWIFVYGLMVFLPAYCVPAERNLPPLRWGRISALPPGRSADIPVRSNVRWVKWLGNWPERVTFRGLLRRGMSVLQWWCRGTPLRWWHYPLAVFVPFLFIPFVPLPLLAGLLFPHHPKVHFPPIGH